MAERLIELLPEDAPLTRVRKVMEAIGGKLDRAGQGMLAEIFRKYKNIDRGQREDEIRAEQIKDEAAG